MAKRIILQAVIVLMASAASFFIGLRMNDVWREAHGPHSANANCTDGDGIWWKSTETPWADTNGNAGVSHVCFSQEKPRPWWQPGR